MKLSAPESPEPPLTALLKGTEFFSALMDDELRYVASRANLLTVPRGASLFRAGDFARRFFIVKDGSIRVYRHRFDGGEDVMALFAPGDALGDFDFARGASYDAYADAVVDSEIVAFPGEGLCFNDLARERPGVAARLKLQSLAMIASRLRSTNKLISENAPWVRELRRRAYEDPGTGLWSCSFLEEEIPAALRGPTAVIALKPLRFKELVDERGHSAGDEAMARVAAVLKDLAGRFGRGWAVRIRSNETALVVPVASAEETAGIAAAAARGIAAIEPFPADGRFGAWTFSAAAAYATWPGDGEDWRNLFGAVYDACLNAWKDSRPDPVKAESHEPS